MPFLIAQKPRANRFKTLWSWCHHHILILHLLLHLQLFVFIKNVNYRNSPIYTLAQLRNFFFVRFISSSVDNMIFRKQFQNGNKKLSAKKKKYRNRLGKAEQRHHNDKKLEISLSIFVLCIAFEIQMRASREHTTQSHYSSLWKTVCIIKLLNGCESIC